MERIKKVARVINPELWPDTAREDMLYWLSRPAAERVVAGRELVRSTYLRLHGSAMPQTSRVGRVWVPEK